MWASGPAAAARPVEAGLGPARDGWPPTSALALLVLFFLSQLKGNTRDIYIFCDERTDVNEVKSYFESISAARRPSALLPALASPFAAKHPHHLAHPVESKQICRSFVGLASSPSRVGPARPPEFKKATDACVLRL